MAISAELLLPQQVFLVLVDSLLPPKQVLWEKHREIIRQMFAPITQALVEDGQIGSQRTVLDIATGPGEPALSVAALVGPEGRVFGIDPIPEMVAAARRAADVLG